MIILDKNTLLAGLATASADELYTNLNEAFPITLSGISLKQHESNRPVQEHLKKMNKSFDKVYEIY